MYALPIDNISYPIPTASYNYAYASAKSQVTSSIKKAWSSIKISTTDATRVDIKEASITPEILQAQGASLEKIWNTPENDVWDEYYKNTNG